MRSYDCDGNSRRLRSESLSALYGHVKVVRARYFWTAVDNVDDPERLKSTNDHRKIKLKFTIECMISYHFLVSIYHNALIKGSEFLISPQCNSVAISEPNKKQ